jgi:hypothetical protein
MNLHLHAFGWALALAAVPRLGAHAQNPPLRGRILTPVQAESLVIASPSNRQKRLPGIQTDQFKEAEFPRYLFFTVVWAPPEKWVGSVVVGNYAVDLETADVWSATTSCKVESNRRLRSLQQRLRLDLGLTDTEYRQLKTNGPLCLK